MDPALFLTDLEQKPQRIRDLAARLRGDDPWSAVGADGPVVLLGMGSSHYANQVAAARLRHARVPAVAELAGSDLLPGVPPGALVLAVSASGGSRETVDAVRRLRGEYPDAHYVALTNRADTELGSLCDVSVRMLAGDEEGGVACRSFQHTLALLLALEQRITGAGDVAGLLDVTAEATEHLLATREEWLGPLAEALLGPDGTHVAAPARRTSSALQSALMLREGPRLPAYACETGDWSHVDVYLTKTTDYRLLLLAGSRWEDELLGWVRERGSTLVAVGAEVPGAALTVRYPYDAVDDVRLLTETLVCEVLAAEAWAGR